MVNIVLTGFMGSGKTTVGKELSVKLSYVFFDIDKFIEQRAKMSVSSIFEYFGEEYFRRLETETAEILSQKSGIIISTGGGTVLNPVNVKALKAGGKIILLDVPLSEITERLKTDTSRPLLNRADKDLAIRQLYNARMPVYRSVADVIINCGQKKGNEVADEIINLKLII